MKGDTLPLVSFACSRAVTTSLIVTGKPNCAKLAGALEPAGTKGRRRGR